MSDKGDNFVSFILEEYKRCAMRFLRKPNVVYISSEWLEIATANPDHEYWGLEKILGLDIIYMDTYSLDDIVVGFKRRNK